MRATTIAGPNHGTSAIVSVTSSCAMWIHHSCGSFTNTQIAAAVMTHDRIATRAGFQNNRYASYAMKKYSNVFGKISSSGRHSVSSNATTPINR
jgi:hypothetical protein